MVFRTDRRQLVGTNLALWDAAELFGDEFWRARLRDLGPTLLRIPGGSWGDIGFWNGHGVRQPNSNQVDRSKLKKKPFSKWSAPFGTWDVDYSAYAPGFNVGNKMEPTEWHGHVDVKTLHEFVRDTGNQAYVIVNAGLGSPRDAAEWVRWANLKMKYGVRYWEVGNELGGSWEAGHFLPDGSALSGAIFARRYEEFASAMKAVDPSIKVGCMDFIDEVLERRGDLVDFVSIRCLSHERRRTWTGALRQARPCRDRGRQGEGTDFEASTQAPPADRDRLLGVEHGAAGFARRVVARGLAG